MTSVRTVIAWAAVLAVTAGGATGVSAADAARNDRTADSNASALFLQENPQAGLFRSASGRITSVYGAAFSTGDNAIDAAQWFVARHAEMFGVNPADLPNVNFTGDGRASIPLMFDHTTGTYKHTLVYFSQHQDGIPVYSADLRVLVRNEQGSPVVLAKSALRDLGGFTVPADAQARLISQAQVHKTARTAARDMANFSNMDLVVWAGTDDMVVAPALAFVFSADNGREGMVGFDRRKFFVDALTGKLLHQESLIHHVDVSGTVRGMLTRNDVADICETEESTAMPYARVSIGATVAYADVNGNFTIPNAGGSPVTVESDMRGQYFRVFNNAGGTDVLSQSVTPPGPVNFLHNAANTSEQVRSQTNTYIAANIVRDYTLAYHPEFPVIAGQTEFPINVNLASTCNAFYDGGSINFYGSGGGCPNTGFGTVVHHEYGHHLVSTAGSGQGAYGEGFGDVIGILVTDNSVLATGFRNNCAAGLRDANNTCQYVVSGCSTCGSAIHDCGRLISGCVWSTRTYLAASNPSDYRTIISGLAINSMPLHQGTAINPSITIDFLTLDDNDADITNGTPHYEQINSGFTDHSMPAPPRSAISFVYPDGRPALLDPTGGVAFRVEVVGVTGSPQAGTGTLFYSTGGGFTSVPMTQVSPNVYDAVFPVLPCGANVSYYVSARSTTNITVTNPPNSPTSTYQAIAATSSSVSFTDDAEADQGWQLGVAGDTAASGQWTRGDPIGTGAQPENDHTPDAGVNCFFTGQGTPGGGLGQADVDGGFTTLVSPTIDLSSVNAPRLSYWRWFSNDQGATPNSDVFLIDISNNNGTNWVNVETVGPSGPEASAGWYFHEVVVSSLLPLTSQMKVRFIAQDLGDGSLVEAAVDDVQIRSFSCDPLPPACPGDWNDDGLVSSQDFFDFLSGFFAGNADFNNSGATDSQDFFDFISAFFTPC